MFFIDKMLDNIFFHQIVFTKALSREKFELLK